MGFCPECFQKMHFGKCACGYKTERRKQIEILISNPLEKIKDYISEHSDGIGCVVWIVMIFIICSASNYYSGSTSEEPETETRMEELQDNIDSLENRINDLERENEELKEQNEELKEQNEELEERIDTIESELQYRNIL